MSNIKCEGCAGEWFTIEKRVRISDERYPAGGVPRYTDGKTLYLCRGCGEPLDMSRLELHSFEPRVLEGYAMPPPRTVPLPPIRHDGYGNYEPS